jgi:hypothetical protein
MYFEINVARNGKHFFATAEQSCTTREEALEVYSEFKKKFPSEEGYKLDITQWDTIGRYMTKEVEEELQKRESKESTKPKEDDNKKEEKKVL